MCRYNSIFLLLIMVLMVGCSRRPDYVLSEGKMADVMTDLQIADAYSQQHGIGLSTPEERRRLSEYVLNKHGVTIAEYDSTVAWYGRNIDKYEEIYNKVDKQLTEKMKQAGKDIPTVEYTDLWPYKRGVEISKLSSTDNLIFNISGESLSKGDCLEWKLRFHTAPQGSSLLGVEYTDGEMAYVSKNLAGYVNFKVSMQTDSARQVKMVFGNIRLTNTDNPIRIDSISLTSIPLDTTQYYKVHSSKSYRQ